MKKTWSKKSRDTVPLSFHHSAKHAPRTFPKANSGQDGNQGSTLAFLKVLANEKRRGLKVVAFNKSPFKLFTLKFSKESVQAPSCKRPKTTQRTPFLSFEINNWFPITLLCRRLIKKIQVTCMPRGEFKHRYWFFADTPNVAWTVSVIWKDLLGRADLYQLRLLKYRGGCTIPLFPIKCMMWKVCRSPTL